jgi:hypothetical protein
MMSTTNVVEPRFSYPKFRDTHTTASQEETKNEIDNSIYQLLSLYLNDNGTAVKTRRHHHGRSMYIPLQHKNWLGESLNTNQDVLERNTLLNSKRCIINEPERKKGKPRKSVSFNDTVTMISQDNTMFTFELKLDNSQEEEEIFVDAVETLNMA